MTRHWFGQSAVDWTFTVGDGDVAVLAGSVVLTFYTQSVSGAVLSDLLDAGGGAVTTITSSDGSTLPLGTIPRFQGPDGVTQLWADAGGGARYLMVAGDLGDYLDGKLDLTGGSMDGPLYLDDDAEAASKDYVDAHAGGGAPSIQSFSYTGIVSVAAGVTKLYNDTSRALTIGTVRATVGTAPVGAALIVDVNRGGTSIYTTQANRPQIASAGTTATGGTPDITSWGVGEYLTVDVDQVGSTTPGSSLIVTIPVT